MALGPRDTTSLVVLTGWDAAELKKHQLQDGTTYDAVVAQINTALAMVNAELYGNPLYSSILAFTDQPELEYREGASNGFGEYTEYGRPDPGRGSTVGHMLPLKPYDRALGWTWDYLRKARASQLQADIAEAIKDVRDLYRQKILTRVLKRTDDSGAANGLGAAGYSPGFATTAGSTNVDFVPPAWGGASFSNTHEHYVAIAGGAWTEAVFQDAKAELREHGHRPPYYMWVSGSDETVIRALTNFVPIAKANIQYSSTVSLATVNGDIDENGSYAIGVLEDFIVRVVPGIPQYWGLGFKSYGANSQRNPLKVRLQKGLTRPQVVAMPDPRSGGGGAYPLQYLMLFTEFGVGVGDRTAATPRYVNNATWADGTAT